MRPLSLRAAGCLTLAHIGWRCARGTASLRSARPPQPPPGDDLTAFVQEPFPAQGQAHVLNRWRLSPRSLEMSFMLDTDLKRHRDRAPKWTRRRAARHTVLRGLRSARCPCTCCSVTCAHGGGRGGEQLVGEPAPLWPPASGSRWPRCRSCVNKSSFPFYVVLA